MKCRLCGHPEATDEHAGISHLPFTKAHAFSPELPNGNILDKHEQSNPIVTGREHEIRPCPFCGSTAEVREADDDANYIECTNPMCAATTNLQYSLMDDGLPQLINRWNRRVGEAKCDLCDNWVKLPNELCEDCKGI